MSLLSLKQSYCNLTIVLSLRAGDNHHNESRHVCDNEGIHGTTPYSLHVNYTIEDYAPRIKFDIFVVVSRIGVKKFRHAACYPRDFCID